MLGNYTQDDNQQDETQKYANFLEIPENMSVEEQIKHIVNEYNTLLSNFQHLLSIVITLQGSLSKSIEYSESLTEDLERELYAHTKNFHSKLIINCERNKKDESGIP